MIIGIGSIQIKMHNGVVRILGVVRHAPELKKNPDLFGHRREKSLPIYLKNVYLCVIDGGVLMVVKNTLVIMKGIRTSSLYILQGMELLYNQKIPCQTMLDYVICVWEYEPEWHDGLKQTIIA